MVPSKKEQIEHLLKFSAYKLVEKYLPKQEWGGDSYKKIFTVKKHEILDYLRAKYILEELIDMTPSNDDGFYAIPLNSGFKIYEQERGFKFLERIVKTEDEVWENFVEYLIRYSGTGLDFT
ncbi:MAG TPA: hypothetical protein VHT73_14680 [Thermodesulfobacteriota bacterium]|nr:hypothetical protein [Thermodesulfobacteriota bacterium]